MNKDKKIAKLKAYNFHLQDMHWKKLYNYVDELMKSQEFVNMLQKC